MDEKLDNKAPCLLISFVVDNGPSMDGARFGALMDAFRTFAEGEKPVRLEWELLSFDAFAPTVNKRFDSADFSPVSADRFPLLGRAVLTAADRLCARAKALRDGGEQVYRPWMFVLSNGFTVDDMAQAAQRLDAMEKGGELLYLPFKLTPKLVTERLQCLDRNKHIVEISAGQIDGFFAFVQRMIERRGALSPDVGIKFAKTDFEGWAVL